GNPQQALRDKGVIDSGCSRHVTRNMSYLSDFEELNGRYVAFGGNPKGGKITGKGKIIGKGNMSYLFDFEELNSRYVAFESNPKGGKISGKVPTVGQISPNNTNTSSDVGPSNAAASSTHGKSSSIDASQLLDDPDMPELEERCRSQMVNIRTDADPSAAVQNALQTLLPQIRAEIREEFRTSSGPSDAGGNPPPVTIHTWLERFNKQKPHSFDVMGCEDAFKTRLAVYKFEGNALAWWKAYKQAKGGDAWLIIERLKREYHSIRQTNTETSTEFMQRFLRLVGFLGAAAGIKEEQAKNFQWGFHRSTINHLMCMSYTDVAQVANAARNYEILHERDDDDVERPDKRQKSGDRHQPTSQQSSHRNHGHNNDRHGSDRRGGSDNHRSSNNNYSGSNNKNSDYGRDQRNRGQ
nr:hypothetical protein [Tanacetum cinerariifolium]